MPKRVLLTGAAGFFGSHLLRHLLVNTDWEIVCICSWKHKGLPQRIKLALGESNSFDTSNFATRVKVLTHDLNSPVPERLRDEIGKIDYILNIASDSHVNRSIENPIPFVQNNVNLALHMLELARELKPQLFLQFSTDEVYGPTPEGQDFPEWSPIVPSNPYSASKACQEAIAISYWRTYGVPLVITNTMNLVGQTQDPEKYTALLIRTIAKDEVVPVHGNNEEMVCSRHYVHARTVAEAVFYIVQHLPPRPYREGEVDKPDRYHIVGKEITNLELAQKVAEALGRELKYKFIGIPKDRPGHDKRYSLSGAKLAKAGWYPTVPFEESLKETVQWTMRNKDWL